MDKDELPVGNGIHIWFHFKTNKIRSEIFMRTLEEIIKKLPPEYEQEVEDFVRFLIEKRSLKQGRKLRQDWAGALRDYRNQYTSMELQKKALEWRGD